MTTIRKFQDSDLDAVMLIWLEANIAAHLFISPDYWFGNYNAVKKTLPAAEVYVCEEDGSVVGFIGLEENFVAGLFVADGKRSRGTGKLLLDFVKRGRTELTLHVYKRNMRAAAFYQREKFTAKDEHSNAQTGEAELTMIWRKAC